LAEQFSLSQWQASFLVASIHVGTVSGSLVGGICVDKWGRRDTILAVSAVYVGSALLLAFAVNLPMVFHALDRPTCHWMIPTENCPAHAAVRNSDWVSVAGRSWSVLSAAVQLAIHAPDQHAPQLICGRVIMGGAVAISAVADCVYISEVAPKESRGAMVSLNEVAITAGVLLAYVASYWLSGVQVRALVHFYLALGRRCASDPHDHWQSLCFEVQSMLAGWPGRSAGDKDIMHTCLHHHERVSAYWNRGLLAVKHSRWPRSTGGGRCLGCLRWSQRCRG
jgi:MFS family permease